MKTVCTVVLALLCLAACQTSQSGISRNDLPPFARYGSLADALRSHAGVYVTGVKGLEKITIRQNQTSISQEPLYVINGQSIGNSYLSANQIVDMAQVTQIRVLKGSSESARYGPLGSGGVILVDTR